MIWEGKPLREISENDLRRVIESGLTEHLQLEYKSALYEDNDRGRREFLLDVCMLANASGGILLIGVTERRDEQGQPTGAPDAQAVLGLEIQNPEAVLTGYDARVTEAVEERLPLESTAIDVSGGRRVLAIRVPSSTSKPHSVRHQGHTYFPSRRERQRYHLTVREIKELVMKTASRLQQAKEMLEESFLEVERQEGRPYLITGIMPAFFEDFSVNVRAERVTRAVGFFSLTQQGDYYNPIYTFDGLERRENRLDYTVRFRRDGLLRASFQLPLRQSRNSAENRDVFFPVAIDSQMRTFVFKAREVYEAAGIDAPYVMGMMLRSQRPLTGAYADFTGFGEVHASTLPARDYLFPFMQIDELSTTDRIIRPLCDQVHQMFGKDGSPSFNADGVWIARYP